MSRNSAQHWTHARKHFPTKKKTTWLVPEPLTPRLDPPRDTSQRIAQQQAQGHHGTKEGETCAGEPAVVQWHSGIGSGPTAAAVWVPSERCRSPQRRSGPTYLTPGGGRAGEVGREGKKKKSNKLVLKHDTKKIFTDKKNLTFAL